MERKTYDELTRRTLRALLDQIDALDDETVDAMVAHDALSVEFDSGVKLIISRQPPVEQLWLAAPNGGFKYDWDGERWMDSKGGGDLGAMFADAFNRARGGAPVSFTAP